MHVETGIYIGIVEQRQYGTVTVYVFQLDKSQYDVHGNCLRRNILTLQAVGNVADVVKNLTPQEKVEVQFDLMGAVEKGTHNWKYTNIRVTDISLAK